MVLIMELVGMVSRGRARYLILVFLMLWLGVTCIDWYSADFRSSMPPHLVRTAATDRHLLNKEDQEETTTNSTLEEYVGFMEWWSKQKQMKTRIQKTCQKYGPSLRQNIDQHELMYDPRHELLFCRNAKVGTTTWLTHFLRLSSLSDSEKNDTMFSSPKLHKNIPPLFQVQEEDLDMRTLALTTTSFSMVRHPFERLVSAYQDKLVDGSDPSYFKVKRVINDKYGKVTFPNFIKLILLKSKTKCQSMNHCTLDKHWRPFISRCAFCNIPYKVVARAETFTEDQFYIGQLAGVHFEQVESHHSSGGSTRDLTRSYFQQLDVKLVERLVGLYQVDLEMFGYSPDLYLSYAGQKQ